MGIDIWKIRWIDIPPIGHFTVACLVTWPLSGSEAGGDLVLIQTSSFSHVDHVVLMLTTLHLHMKSMRFVSKQCHRQPQFHSKARSQKHTTVKWTIASNCQQLIHVGARKTVARGADVFALD